MQSSITLELTGNPNAPMRVIGDLKDLSLREFFSQVFKHSPEWTEMIKGALEDAEQCSQ